jgi:hypothetical protein
MKITVYLSEDDRVAHHGLGPALIERARQLGLSRATLWRGIEGLGRSGRLRTARFPDSSTGLPLVMEVVDDVDGTDAFLGVVRELAPGALVTRQEVQMSPTPRSGD